MEKLKLMSLLRISSILLILMGCGNDLSVFVPSGSQSFSITSQANLISADSYLLEWTKSKYATRYEVLIAQDPLCLKEIFKVDDLTVTELSLDSLNDGNYYLCVYARYRNAIVSAKNNGVLLTIDRTDPIVTIPPEIQTFGKAFVPDVTIKDSTQTTTVWSQISGPGKVAFSDEQADHPRVTADQNGIYKLKASITDKVGHTVEQIYQFYWEGSVPNAMLSFIALVKSGVAVQGYINDADKNSNSPLWILKQKHASSILYTQALDDGAGNVVCDSNQNYTESQIARPSDLNLDGTYTICVKLGDTDGHTIYGKADTVVRDTVAPVFTQLALANSALDSLITASEQFLVSPMWALQASDYEKALYTSASPNAANSLVCDGTLNYSETAIASPSTLAVDGDYALCVKLVDAAGNISYGKSASITRDTSAPVFTALSLANAASDGFINDSEKTSVLALWSLSASRSTSESYTLPLDNSSNAVACDGSQTYGQSLIAKATDLPSDGTYVICVKLANSIGNLTFGKSTNVTRDIVFPVLTSMQTANAAIDGYIASSEKTSTLALWSLVASGYSQASFTAALSDAGSSLVCDGSLSYSLSSSPSISSLTGDGVYASCVKLADAAGNTVYGKSPAVTRSTAGPTLTFVLAGDASDGFISSTETASTLPLWDLTQSGATTIAYTSVLSDTGGSLVCDGSKTYDKTGIAIGTDLTTDGAYSMCVTLVDTLGNTTFGKAPQVVRGTSGPIFGSLTLANDASDGYINDGEKLSSAVLWTLHQTGGTTIAYTPLLNDAGGTVVCDGTQTYSESTIPRASDITSEGNWVICVQLTDAFSNTNYGKSSVVVRDTRSPVFSSLITANAATDSYVNDSEKLLISPLWTLSGSGYTIVDFTNALDDTSGALTCDGSQTYSESTIAGPSGLGSDGAYSLCVRLQDAAGNTVYGKASQIIRDTVAPAFTSLAGANEASNGEINSSEKDSTQALYTLTASGYSVAAYTPGTDDTSSALSCDASKTYGNATVPLINSLALDGTFAVCVKLSDAAGNNTFGKSSQVVRKTSLPTFTSLSLINAASDGYVNDSEKALTTVLWSLSQSGASVITYTSPLDDSGSSLSCDGSQTYDQSTIARASDLSSDDTWVICVKLTDSYGNSIFGKSAAVIRDIQAPSFTSLALANAASDGFIGIDETALTTAMWSLNASGQDTTSYTVALSDAAGTLTCGSGDTYNQSSIASPDSLSTDGTYVICVKLSDTAGNIAYGKSAVVVRDVVGPSFTSLALANEASDGYVSDAEKALTSALYSLNASGHASAQYSAALNDSGGSVACDATQTYGSATIPTIDTLSSDGIFAVCVLLTDAAGNKTYGKSAQVIRQTTGPVVTSFAGANAASDGYISNAEKNLTTLAWGITQTGATSLSYTAPLDDTGAAVVCDASKTYGQSTISRAVDLTSDKPWVLCAKLVDVAGNITYEKSSQVVRDTTGPLAPVITSPVDGVTTTSPLTTVSGTTESGATVSVYKDGVLSGTTTASGTSWTYTFPSALGDGTYSLTAEATDTLGNVGTLSSATQVTVALPPPTANAGADVITNVEVTLVGTSTNAASVAWTKVSGTGVITFGSASSGTTTVRSNTNGTFVLRFTVTGTSGATVSDDVTFVWDTTVPTFGGIKQTYPVSSTSMFVSWSQASDTVTSADKIIYEVCYSETVGSCASNFVVNATIPANTWDYTAVGLTADTPYEFLVRAKDEAGNVNTGGSAKRIGSYLGDVVFTATGESHTCVIVGASRIVKCWGTNYDGQLGNGTNTGSIRPVTVSGLSDVESLSLGYEFSCALLSDQTVKCWGNGNSAGSLGNNSTASKNAPVAVSGVTGAIKIAAGNTHACALLSGGGVKCWGDNASGQIGDGTKTNRSVATSVSGISTATDIDAANKYSCAVLTDGTAKCWGDNYYSQLGDGTYTDRTTPVAVNGLTGVSKIATGYTFNCALLTNQTVKCWGYNYSGQLGNGTNSTNTSPVTVSGLSDVTFLTAGDYSACALLSNGTVKCWGDNGYGQLGDTGVYDRNTPAVVPGLTGIQNLSRTVESTYCAVLADGTMRCWGCADYGKMGDGLGNFSATPVQVGGLTNSKKIVSAEFHSCSLQDDSTVQCWGTNSAGEIGNGTTAAQPTPLTVSGLSNVSTLALGSHFTCALLATGSVNCWGANGDGQLGRGNTTDSTTPVAVSGISNAVDISAGTDYACAVLSTGTVKCWGYNSDGLGNGSSYSNSPVSVSSITTAVKVSTYEYHSCALLSDKTVKCWGYNYYGELGDGTTTNRSSPVSVSGLSNVDSIALGHYTSCAVLNDQTVKCWGSNYNDILTNGSGQSTTPVTVAGISNAVQISLDYYAACAVLSDKTLKCWGYNYWGQYGNGTTSSNSTGTTLLPGLTGVENVSVNRDYVCATLSDKTARCWGGAPYAIFGSTAPLSRNRTTPSARVADQ